MSGNVFGAKRQGVQHDLTTRRISRRCKSSTPGAAAPGVKCLCQATVAHQDHRRRAHPCRSTALQMQHITKESAMSSTNQPQVRKPYQRAPGESSSSAERKVKASECGLVENADGSIKEVGDNKKIFRLRIATTGGPNGTSYHLRVTFCGYVWWSPSFWTKRVKNECFVLKPKAPTPEK